MEYEKARSYIDESHRFGGEVSLKAITGFLARLGNPQWRFCFMPVLLKAE